LSSNLDYILKDSVGYSLLLQLDNKCIPYSICRAFMDNGKYHLLLVLSSGVMMLLLSFGMQLNEPVSAALYQINGYSRIIDACFTQKDFVVLSLVAGTETCIAKCELAEPQVQIGYTPLSFKACPEEMPIYKAPVIERSRTNIKVSSLSASERGFAAYVENGQRLIVFDALFNE
jgi:hypothetical protein